MHRAQTKKKYLGKAGVIYFLLSSLVSSLDLVILTVQDIQAQDSSNYAMKFSSQFTSSLCQLNSN